MKMAQNKMSYKKTISVATQTEAVTNYIDSALHHYLSLFLYNVI